jgi:hypothetical protein
MGGGGGGIFKDYVILPKKKVVEICLHGIPWHLTVFKRRLLLSLLSLCKNVNATRRNVARN